MERFGPPLKISKKRRATTKAPQTSMRRRCERGAEASSRPAPSSVSAGEVGMTLRALQELEVSMTERGPWLTFEKSLSECHFS
jgi:hypothetical protein